MSFVERYGSDTFYRARSQSLSNDQPIAVFVENYNESDVETCIFLAVSRTSGRCKIKFAG